MKKIFTFLLFAAASVSMMGADIVVTTVADGTVELDGEVPAGSLRAAIADAQSGDVIKFNTTDGDAVALKAGLSLSGDGKVLIIDGLNAATGKPIVLTKGDAAAGVRVFGIATGAGSEGLDVTLKNISFENIASTTNGSAIAMGGSAYGTTAHDPNFSVTLEKCQFINCTTEFTPASSGGGGAVFVSHGTGLIINNCLFADNAVRFTTGPSTSISFGGGAIGSTGSNTAAIKIYNSTFYGNVSDGRGGGIYSGHHLDIINSTIAGNTSAGRGGGLHLNASGSTVNIINTIVAHNHGGEATNEDFYPPSTPLIDHSIIGITPLTQEKIDAAGPNNLLYTTDQPLFAGGSPILAANGGWYKTIALAETGVASGQGIASVAGFTIPTTDQRGATRLTPPSIGAYEYGGTFSDIQQVSTATAVVTVSTADGQIVIAAENQGVASVYNVTGAQVAQTSVAGAATISNLSKGIYIVKFVETTGSTSIVKVLLK